MNKLILVESYTEFDFVSSCFREIRGFKKWLSTFEVFHRARDTNISYIESKTLIFLIRF